MENFAPLLTEQMVVLAALAFVFLIAFLYCWGVTGSTPFALMVCLAEEVKSKRDPEKKKCRESAQEKRIKAAPSVNISMTGGVGTGTVSEVLAQQTSIMLQEGVDIQDDFTTDLLAGECPAIEQFLGRTDSNDKR